MTVKGFDSLESSLSDHDTRSPQVYIHEDKITRKVLRIGKAKNGVLDRWIKNTSGHACTFLWAIGESPRYRSLAKRYPHYLTFFAGLYGRETDLHVLTLDPTKLSQTETEFRHKYRPIWESYLKDPATNDLRNNAERVEVVSELGGAFKIIKGQRAYLNPLPYKILDVVELMNSCSTMRFQKTTVLLNFIWQCSNHIK